MSSSMNGEWRRGFFSLAVQFGDEEGALPSSLSTAGARWQHHKHTHPHTHPAMDAAARVVGLCQQHPEV